MLLLAVGMNSPSKPLMIFVISSLLVDFAAIKLGVFFDYTYLALSPRSRVEKLLLIFFCELAGSKTLFFLLYLGIYLGNAELPLVAALFYGLNSIVLYLFVSGLHLIIKLTARRSSIFSILSTAYFLSLFGVLFIGLFDVSDKQRFKPFFYKLQEQSEAIGISALRLDLCFLLVAAFGLTLIFFLSKWIVSRMPLESSYVIQKYNKSRWY